MSRTAQRVGVAIGLAALLGGCSGMLQGAGDDSAEYVGYLAPEGFTPCEATPGRALWRPTYAGPAVRQAEHLRSTGLLSLSRPLLVQVSGRVSAHQPGSMSGGFTHTISITDILGMWITGGCEDRGAGFRPLTQAHP